MLTFNNVANNGWQKYIRRLELGSVRTVACVDCGVVYHLCVRGADID